MNNLNLTAFCLALACYALALLQLWRKQSSRSKDVLDAEDDNAPRANIALIVALVGLAAHCVVTHNTLIQSGSTSTLTLSVLGVSNLVVGVMLLVIAISSIKAKADSLLLLLLPLVIVNLLGLVTLPAGQTQPIQLDGGQISHILLSISAYAALMTAALQSILIAIQERRLRSLQSGLFGLLPPMEAMEALFITILWIGLGLLTLSIATGALFLQNMFDQRLVHHTVLTTLSWLVYAGFLAGHHLFGWRGVSAVRWNLAAFALLLLGYLGSKFVIEYLL
jgi:ABC-type uncharacterized transport system permease subunit